MSYNENEKQTVIDVIQTGNLSEMRITRVDDEDGSFKAVDIRKWFCTQKDSTMKLTQKGIRIYAENLEQVMNALKSCSN